MKLHMLGLTLNHVSKRGPRLRYVWAVLAVTGGTHALSVIVLHRSLHDLSIRCDMAFIEPMHRNKPNITYLLPYLLTCLLLTYLLLTYYLLTTLLTYLLTYLLTWPIHAPWGFVIWILICYAVIAMWIVAMLLRNVGFPVLHMSLT